MGSLFLHQPTEKAAAGTPIIGTAMTGDHKLRDSEALVSRCLGGILAGKRLSQDTIYVSLGHKSSSWEDFTWEQPYGLDGAGCFKFRETDVQFGILITSIGSFNFSSWSLHWQPAGERICLGRPIIFNPPAPAPIQVLDTPEALNCGIEDGAEPVTLDWTASDNATGYRIRIFIDDVCGGDPIIETFVSGQVTTYEYPIGTFPGGSLYSWQVQAVGDGVTTTDSLWSNCCMFGVCGVLTQTASFGFAFIGAFYSVTITPAGGEAPYTFQLGTGVLPNGLILSSAGVVEGTPV